ncbi:hypothetical protein [Aureimonas psammosilenae]|uniref:hypothetical protein n=1 Tax=Aureimonas psammosilenae TaxID=2495496 RepID=UPI00126059F2|nr:hypothetical protein [Aureimonas psammosilenae]
MSPDLFPIDRTSTNVVRLHQDTAEALLGRPFDGDRHSLAQACATRIRRPVDPSRIEVVERGAFAVFGPWIEQRRRYAIVTGESPEAVASRLAGRMLVFLCCHRRITEKVSI